MTTCTNNNQAASCRKLTALLMLLAFAYLGTLLYFLTIRPGGANGNPVVIWSITAFASGGMVFMGVFAVMLYLFRRWEKAALYFALLAFSAAVRFFFMEGSQTVMGLAPGFPHSAVYAVRYIALGCFIAGITGFVYEYFAPPEKLRKPFKALSAVTVAAYILLAVLSALRDGDSAAMRMLVVVPTLGVQVFSLIIIVKSPDVKGNRLNRFYLATVIAYMAEAVLAGLFTGRFANIGVVTGSFFVIVHTVMLCERITRALDESELLNSLHKSKSDFLSDLNHELCAPLSVITSTIAYAKKMIEINGDMQKAREMLDTACSEALRAGRMIDGMSTMAERNNKVGNRQRLALAEIVREVVEPFRWRLESFGVEFRLMIAQDLPDVFVEREQFIRVIFNLLKNAVRYTRYGSVHVSVWLEGQRVSVLVSDTGEGIAPDLLPRVFELGGIGKSGAGCGLYVCKKVVEAHGGEITITSEPDEGTRVVFTVPVYGGQEYVR